MIRKIFIHGWSFSREIWADFKTIDFAEFIDLPFHNNFSYCADKNILENFSREITRKINKGNNPVILIGWSLGATIAVLTALKNPKNLNKIILIGFSPKFNHLDLGHNPLYIKAFMMALRKNFNQTIYNFRFESTGKKFENIPIPQKEGSIKILKEYIQLDLTSQLSKINVPTILIHGTNDKIVNYKGSVYSYKKIKNSSLILLKSHHAPFLTHKNQFLETINRQVNI